MLCYDMILDDQWVDDDPCGQMLKKDESKFMSHSNWLELNCPMMLTIEVLFLLYVFDDLKSLMEYWLSIMNGFIKVGYVSWS